VRQGEFVYDSGALIAIDKRGADVLQRHERRVGRGNRIIVPAPAAAQAIRQPRRQARLMLTLRGCRIVAFDEESAGPVGTLLADAGQTDVVDAFVVMTAAKSEAAIVTTDAGDMRHMLDILGVDLPVLAP